VILDQPCRQADFGELVGIGQPAVSEMVSRGLLENGAPLRQWLLAYCGRLREQAAGRLGSEAGGLDLAQERAALAREQRIGIALKNAVLRGEYASIAMLGEVLDTASQAVAERFDHLPGQVRKACPDLPPAAVDQVMAIIAAARNEWVRSTVALVTANMDQGDDDDADLAGLDDEPRAD
jgi:phage terminase Nu1 subunit (DNA packaging protein)